jgi:hypothetical protein
MSEEEDFLYEELSAAKLEEKAQWTQQEMKVSPPSFPPSLPPSAPLLSFPPLSISLRHAQASSKM